MGAGAPIRDNSGHVMAERGNVYDRVSITIVNNSPPSESRNAYEKIKKWEADSNFGNDLT